MPPPPSRPRYNQNNDIDTNLITNDNAIGGSRYGPKDLARQNNGESFFVDVPPKFYKTASLAKQQFYQQQYLNDFVNKNLYSHSNNKHNIIAFKKTYHNVSYYVVSISHHNNHTNHVRNSRISMGCCRIVFAFIFFLSLVYFINNNYKSFEFIMTILIPDERNSVRKMVGIKQENILICTSFDTTCNCSPIYGNNNNYLFPKQYRSWQNNSIWKLLFSVAIIKLIFSYFSLCIFSISINLLVVEFSIHKSQLNYESRVSVSSNKNSNKYTEIKIKMHFQFPRTSNIVRFCQNFIYIARTMKRKPKYINMQNNIHDISAVQQLSSLRRSISALRHSKCQSIGKL